jgi:hypothetical protein
MANYKERFEAMKAAENAMKTTPKTREVRDSQTTSTKTERSGPSKESMQNALDAAMRRKEEMAPTTATTMGEPMKKGGCVKMAKGGSASKRADGCAQRGKTRGKMV